MKEIVDAELRIVDIFLSLASEMEKKAKSDIAEFDDLDHITRDLAAKCGIFKTIDTTWTAAAASVRRVCEDIRSNRSNPPQALER